MIYRKIPLSETDENIYLDVYAADIMREAVSEQISYKRKAILVIPGGGYGCVCSEREGEPIALAFMAHGFNAFVLHYSVRRVNSNVYPTQLIEASMAMKYIKDHAEEYGMDKDKVFATGFSAGGHLCASLGILWDIPEIYEAIDMPHGYNKPTGIMPIYPVITSTPRDPEPSTFENLFGTAEGGLTKEMLDIACLDRHVTDKASPAFIVHTSNDAAVPVQNSLILADAYSRCGMTFELHVYPDAPHGVALGNDITRCGIEKWSDPAIAKWVEHAVLWTKQFDN